ncbi:MAG: acyltransferase [Bacteroidota bacterium]
MTIKKEKDLTVETLRGAVIILVVIGHVIGSGSDGGMKVSEDSFLRHFYYTFAEFLQMPLFTVIAGWVYTLKPVTYEKIGDFIGKKFIRVLLPMFVVGACYFLLQYLTPGTNRKGNLADIWRLIFFPYTLFWYLYSLFLVFLVVAVIDAYHKMETFTSWLAIFLVTTAVLVLRDIVIPEAWPNYLSYKGAVYLLPCFILGVGLNRFKPLFQNRVFFYSVLVILVLSVVIQQLSWYKIIEYSLVKDSGVGLLLGLTGTILLLRLPSKVGWLIWFGSFAYSIYLFHAFGTAGGRIIVQKFGIQSIPVVFTFSLIAGLFLPILADYLLSMSGITRMLFLGKSYHTVKKEKTQPASKPSA